jgi:hypothetical protein
MDDIGGNSFDHLRDSANTAPIDYIPLSINGWKKRVRETTLFHQGDPLFVPAGRDMHLDTSGD